MSNEALIYAFRSIIRMLNGDSEEAAALARKAEVSDTKNGYFKIGQVIPDEIKKKIYRMVG